MRRIITLLVGAVVAAGMTVAPAQPASADTTTITGDDWSMTIAISSTFWSDLFTTNFLDCKDLTIQLTVAAPPGRAWSLAGRIVGDGSDVDLESFAIAGVGPQWTPIPITGVSMCQHFGGSVTPQDHRYVATGLATVADSAQPTLPFEVPFTIEPMSCSVHWLSHELRNGVSAFLGEVVAYTNDGFRRPAPAGTVTLERLEGITWLKAGETTSLGDGSFVVVADTLLATGSYARFQYTDGYWYAANAGMPLEVWPPFTPLTPPVVTTLPVGSPAPVTPAPVVQPKPTVKLKAVSGRSKLKVDVNPNLGTKYWTFQVQRKNTDGSWKALKTYRTRGSKETRTVNLRKGTYRVWVNPKLWYQGAMSPTEITLKR